MSIKANELRLGNWVLGENGFPLKISAYDFEHTMFDKTNPILLTPEILEKAGFMKERESNYTKIYTNIKNEQFGYNWHDRSGWTARYYGENINHTQYLHQLQNLYFALTSEELKIEL